LYIRESYQQLKEMSLLMSYIILRGSRFHIIVLDDLAPTEGKIGDMKESFYEELERIFDNFLK
jgi:hypothetical protein